MRFTFIIFDLLFIIIFLSYHRIIINLIKILYGFLIIFLLKYYCLLLFIILYLILIIFMIIRKVSIIVLYFKLIYTKL